MIDPNEKVLSNGIIKLQKRMQELDIETDVYPTEVLPEDAEVNLDEGTTEEIKLN